MDQRSKDIETFYGLVSKLREKLGGPRLLKNCDGRMDWPRRGVYFFFEETEFRENKNKLRVVRVGTHAVSEGSKTTLWNRLKTHKGREKGTGNHRGSVFRKLVGFALINKESIPLKTWGEGKSAPREIRLKEQEVEKMVSEHIGKMPLLWLKIDDKPSKESNRAYIERNAIALLSNFGKEEVIDLPSKNWLGKSTSIPKMVKSGLWNQRHVDEEYDPSFLRKLKEFINQM